MLHICLAHFYNNNFVVPVLKGDDLVHSMETTQKVIEPTVFMVNFAT